MRIKDHIRFKKLKTADAIIFENEILTKRAIKLGIDEEKLLCQTQCKLSIL